MEGIRKITNRVQDEIRAWETVDNDEQSESWKLELARIVGQWPDILGDLDIHPGAIDVCLTDLAIESENKTKDALDRISGIVRAAIGGIGLHSSYPGDVKENAEMVRQRLEESGWLDEFNQHAKSMPF